MTHAKDRLVTFQWLGVARRGFLNVGIINIHGLGFFVVGGFPVQFLSSAPGLYPLDAFTLLLSHHLPEYWQQKLLRILPNVPWGEDDPG